MMKVAQGWVLNWSAPERLVAERSIAERVQSSAVQSGSGLLPALSQVHLDSAPAAASVAGGQQQQQQQQAASYTVEFRERGASWQSLGSSRERSLLLKDLKPGSEYMFRIFAHSQAGARGAPSAEFKYTIPDNRRKPGSTQALSAGVVSGILFFIACIVIAVCAVNMCNKRRKKRAEKGKFAKLERSPAIRKR